MKNAPTLNIAHFLGRPPAPDKVAELRKQKLRADRGDAKADREARSAGFRTQLAAIVGKPAAAAAKPSALRGATKAAASAKAAPPKAAAPAKRKATAPSFDHLVPAPASIEDDMTPAADKAQAIVASAAKARGVVPVKKPAKGTAAAAILAAAAKRDTPTGTGAEKPKGLAADIIAAGRRRRGEAP